MINSDRIVPVQVIDLISLYGLILKQDSNNSSLAALAASDTAGDFAVTATGVYLANEPVSSLDIASSVSSVTVYFVPAYDYAGFTKAGVAATIADNDVTVDPDGRTLYKAVLSSGAVTITKVGF